MTTFSHSPTDVICPNWNYGYSVKLKLVFSTHVCHCEAGDEQAHCGTTVIPLVESLLSPLLLYLLLLLLLLYCF